MLRFADHPTHLAVLREAALRAVDPEAAVRRSFSAADFADAERVFIVGAGKAGVAMAKAVAEVLGEHLTAGLVSVPNLPPHSPKHITFIQGGHPLPTKDSLAAGRTMAELLSQTTERDLVVALISGGGSALLDLLHPGLTLQDLQCTNAHLLQCGAAIHEFNTVRIQLSQIKGGGLARFAYPACVLGLILSDVVGNPLDIIASGLTVPTTATRQDALNIIEKYHLSSALPPSVIQHLRSAPDSHSTIRIPQPAIENRLIGSNRLAGEAAVAAARELGFEAIFVADDWQGEAREVGRRFAELVASPPFPASPLLPPFLQNGGRSRGRGARCLIVGGESTVTVHGTGSGGRNQEVALAAALTMAGLKNIAIATFATDGVDGPTDAAGAMVTGDTISRARALGLDPHQYLENNDAYSFFAALGDLVLTGPTGTNVNDLFFGLVY